MRKYLQKFAIFEKLRNILRILRIFADFNKIFGYGKPLAGNPVLIDNT